MQFIAKILWRLIAIMESVFANLKITRDKFAIKSSIW